VTIVTMSVETLAGQAIHSVRAVGIRMRLAAEHLRRMKLAERTNAANMVSPTLPHADEKLPNGHALVYTKVYTTQCMNDDTIEFVDSVSEHTTTDDSINDVDEYTRPKKHHVR